MDEAAVWAEYERLGYGMGWVFAMTPLAKLTEAGTVVVGLNPGGDGGEGCWEHLDGNAYFTGKWTEKGSPLPIQVQVRAWHELLGLGPDDVFAAQFIPFRSPSLIKLLRSDEALGFARELWRWALPQSPAKLFICMGSHVAWQIAELLQAKEQGRFATGWGNTKVIRYVGPGGRVVVGVPHPSRYFILSQRGTGKLEMARCAIMDAARPASDEEFARYSLCG